MLSGAHRSCPRSLAHGCGRAWTKEVAKTIYRPSTGPSRVGRAYAVRALAQADRRTVRLTVAGPPDGQPPRVIEVDDPLSAPAELICTNENVHLQKAGITKSEAREQAAIIQAQREEISTLRQALAETQDVMFKGKAALNEVVQTKDLQIAQLYELAANGVRERAKLRQELSDIQAEMQGTKRQLHAFMASLMQLKSSMDSAGDGDIEHALELLQSSSWTQSLQGTAIGQPLPTDDDVYMQLVQMQKLSDSLVQDMQQDEELMQQGLEPRSRLSSLDGLDSPDSSIEQPPVSKPASIPSRPSSPTANSNSPAVSSPAANKPPTVIQATVSTPTASKSAASSPTGPSKDSSSSSTSSTVSTSTVSVSSSNGAKPSGGNSTKASDASAVHPPGSPAQTNSASKEAAGRPPSPVPAAANTTPPFTAPAIKAPSNGNSNGNGNGNSNGSSNGHSSASSGSGPNTGNSNPGGNGKGGGFHNWQSWGWNKGE